MDRTQLFDTLSNLPPAAFERLLIAVNMPRMNRAGAAATIGEQVSALLGWAESSIGPGVETIAQHLTELNHFEFDAYLRSLVATYEKWWEYYTLTDVEGKVNPPAPKKPSVFDFGLMVQTVVKETDGPGGDPRAEEREKTERLPVLEGIRKYADDHVLLVGRPGSGKSTALIRLLLEEATQALQHSNGQVPVLVELRYWNVSIEVLIQGFLQRHGLMLDDSTLSTLLSQGRFLLLVDGLNELPSESARTQLSAFRRNHPKVPMIFTTRDLGLGGDLGIEKKLEMQPLTEVQMKDFIRTYVPDQAEVMLRQLSDRLREFGQTPLLLWMLCEVFQQAPNRQMPTNLAEVFRAFTTMYEDSSVRKHEVALLKGDVRPLSDRRLWKEALKALAALMMQGETPVDFRVAIHRTEAEHELGKIFANEKFPVRDILDDLLKHHLLQNRTTDQLEFRHQLIQEYYAAEHLLDLLPDLLKDEEKFKRDYLNLGKWTESIALTLALVGDEAYSLRVVKLVIDDVDLMLGARLAGEVRLDYQEKTTNYILQKDLPEWSKVDLLGKSRTKIAKQNLLKYLDHPNVEMILKSAALIGETDEQAVIDTIRHKLEAIDEKFFSQTSYGGPDRTGNIWTFYVEALAHLSPQRATSFLKKKLLTKEGINFDLRIYYHTEAAQLLMSLDSDNLFPIIKKGLQDLQQRSQMQLTLEEHQDLTKTSIWSGRSPDELRNMGLDNCKSILLSLLSYLENRDLMQSLVVSALRKETSASVKIEMIRLLISSNNSQIGEALIELLSDESFKVRMKACLKLIDQKTTRIIELEKLLTLEDLEFSWPAAFVLGSLGHTTAFPILLRTMQTEDFRYLEMRRYTARLLGSLNSDFSLPILRKFLKDDSKRNGFESFVRKEAIFSLARMGDQECIPEFMNNFRTGFRDDRVSSIKSFKKLHLESELWKILKERSLAWQTAAVELGNLGYRRVSPDLCEALIDSGAESAGSVIELIAKLADINTIYWLLDALQNPGQHDSDSLFPNRVALTLVGCDIKLLGNHIQSLISMAKAQYIEQLPWLIPAIQQRCQFYNYEIAHGLVPLGETISLYLSYAPTDEALQTQLANHLTLLDRQGVITSWSSHQVLPGDDRTQTIHQQLNTADIILLLISANSLSDDTCYHLEIQRAMERHQSGEARVIPILLRPVDWQSAPFNQLDVLPKNHQPVTTWQNQDEAFQEIAAGIREIALELRRNTPAAG